MLFLFSAFNCLAAPTTVPGWKVELIAQAPDVKHPSVVCAAPDGRVFVAEDPMDIRTDTPANSRQGRIVCLHPDGRRTVFAENLHAVFGMQYLEGNLYVLHNPLLTVFRDDHGVGREARDILTHTLPRPWEQDWNDHIPANFKLGMDGYFHLAVGDKGLENCTGTDGRKITLKGGGIVRFRPDGSGLEVFSTGLRNILDVALNSDDEFFTYDNTDENHWMGRLTHMVEAGFYGYPHDFIPRRPYTLWMMHDFGAGAACGTLCNTDDGLPPGLAENLFLSDFGKRQVTRVRVEREGASYRVADSEELFPNPPDDFRPVGLGWSPDGRSLLVCDWQHRDSKADVSVGRLWKLTRTEGSNPAPRPGWWRGLAMGETPPAAVPTRELLDALAHPPREYVSHRRHGWEVLVEKQLADEDAVTTKATLDRVEKKLGEVATLLPPATLADLRKLRVFILYGTRAKAGGRGNGLEYFRADAPTHPDWLDARMGRSIVIFDAANDLKLSEAWALQSLVHEFGHAQHLEDWPEDHEDIHDAGQAAMKAGLFQTVRDEDKGTPFPNYAAPNHLEYFAELTTVYFVGANCFSKDRARLKACDPAGFAPIEKLRGLHTPPPAPARAGENK